MTNGWEKKVKLFNSKNKYGRIYISKEFVFKLLLISGFSFRPLVLYLKNNNNNNIILLLWVSFFKINIL